MSLLSMVTDRRPVLVRLLRMMSCVVLEGTCREDRGMEGTSYVREEVEESVRRLVMVAVKSDEKPVYCLRRCCVDGDEGWCNAIMQSVWCRFSTVKVYTLFVLLI